MNKTFFLPVIIVFFTLYYFLFPLEGAKELIWSPSASWDLASGDGPEEELLVSRGGFRTLLGAGGERLFSAPPGQTGVLGRDVYFYKEKDVLFLRNLTDGSLRRVEAEGEPVVLSSHIYAAELGSGRVREIDGEGDSLWSWQGLGPVTAMAAGGDTTALGSLDGRVRLFNRDGMRTVIEPAGENRIIYGLALSPDAERLAILSGLEEQTVQEFDLKSLSPLTEPRLLKSRFRRPVRLYYSGDGKILWVEQVESLLQLGPGEEDRTLRFRGNLLALEERTGEGQIMVLSREQRQRRQAVYYLNLFSLDGSFLGRTGFRAAADDFIEKDGHIYLSVEGRLIKLERWNA